MNSKSANEKEEELEAIAQRLQEIEEERAKLLDRKSELDLFRSSADGMESMSADEKVALFSSLFVGREDIHAYRWENTSGKSGYALACDNEWQPGVCNKPKIKCGECPNKAYTPPDASAIYQHLSGTKIIGLYPLGLDDTCNLLAVDFDKSDWRQAAQAYSSVCDDLGLSHAVERSRSGRGAHIWVFFHEKVPAAEARRLGFLLLDRAMDKYPGLSFESYDRLFPNQDAMPSGGFGNLIALPLQYHPRQHGNSVFVDGDWAAYSDQWRFLSSIRRVSRSELTDLLKDCGSNLSEQQIKPWEQGLPVEHSKIEGCPRKLKIVLANRVYIPSTTLPSTLLARLKRIASFANPVFFKTQAMRFSTHGIPRYICLASIEQDYLAVPRGCREEITEMLGTQGISIEFDDKRQPGEKLDTIRFLGKLRDDQRHAVKELARYDTGVLHAPTAFGKTVTAIGLISKRRVNTLILTHTRQLVDQWKERLLVFLEGVDIGSVGGGKRKPTGSIDVATYQSLMKRKENTVDPLVLDYGQVIIDECHHVSAPNYDRLLSEVRAKYVLGLTATTERQDGHQPIVFMHVGAVRHRVKNENLAQFEQRVHVRKIWEEPPEITRGVESKPHIADVYRWLMHSETRNSMIVADVADQLKEGANPLVLTERREHAQLLCQEFTDAGYEAVVLRGAMRARELENAKDRAKSAQILIATGKYIGEGFDMPRLDTLFLALPISWKGTLAQYVGRIHRTAEGKSRVTVYDYVDENMPMLERMFQRRCKGYEAMGYTLIQDGEVPLAQVSLEV